MRRSGTETPHTKQELGSYLVGDRRSYVRIAVDLPATLIWMDDRSLSQKGAIMNISRAGVLINLGKRCGQTLPPLGTGIHLDIELPLAKGFPARCLHCEGTVIRFSKSVAKPIEIAVKVSSMSFRNA